MEKENNQPTAYSGGIGTNGLTAKLPTNKYSASDKAANNLATFATVITVILIVLLAFAIVIFAKEGDAKLANLGYCLIFVFGIFASLAFNWAVAVFVKMYESQRDTEVNVSKIVEKLCAENKDEPLDNSKTNE
mgnify:CR=1 FL=1